MTYPPEENKDCNAPTRKDRFLAWVDSHPRTGWYIVGLLVFNTILNLIEVFK